MKSILTIILIIGSFTCTAQKAILDTTLTGQVFLKDTKTNIVYEVFKDDRKSYIIKDGKKLFLYRREKDSKPEPTTTKN